MSIVSRLGKEGPTVWRLGVGIGPAVWIRSAGYTAVLALSFIWGFAVEMGSFLDEFPSSVATLGAVGPWAFVLTVALTTLLTRDAPLLFAGLAGLLLGSHGAILFVLGLAAPLMLQLGERRLADLAGEEIHWFPVLMGLLVMAALVGAGIGALCGAASRVWHVRIGWKGDGQ